MAIGELNAPSGVREAANKGIMYELDLVTGELTWNDALYNLLGYGRAEPFGRLDWWINHIHPDDAMILNRAMDKLADPAIPMWTVDYRFRNADGSYMLMRDRASILRNTSGQAIRLIGTLTPLTPAADR